VRGDGKTADRRAGKSKRRIPPIAGLLLGILAVSTASTWIRLAQADVPSLALAAWRLTFASLMLAPFAVTTARPEWRRLQPRDWVCLAVSGAVLAVHFYTWITSLALTSVAASVVLVSTNPLFVALLSHFLLGERVRLQVIIGILIAVAGSAIMGWETLRQARHSCWGTCSPSSALCPWPSICSFGRQQRQHLSLLGYVFPVYGVAALCCWFSLLSGTPLWGYPPGRGAWLLARGADPTGHRPFILQLGTGTSLARLRLSGGAGGADRDRRSWRGWCCMSPLVR
jgi:drug/metabolite transporter (DMT)-like permease